MEDSKFRYKQHKHNRDEHLRFERFRRDLGRKVKDIDTLPLLFYYTTVEEKEKIKGNILARALSPSTVTVSIYESMFKKALLEANIPVIYEPLCLPLRTNGNSTARITRYKPDFLLPNHYIEGKSIVIEPHGTNFLNLEYLRALRKARQTYGLYVVLAITEGIMMRGISEQKVQDHVDKVWTVDLRDSIRGTDQIRGRLRMFLRKTEIRSESSVENLIDKLRVNNPPPKNRAPIAYAN
jgi:hypothetical protein